MPGNPAAAERRPDRFRRVIQSFSQGHRFGVAMADIGGAFSSATHRLAALHEERERKPESTIGAAERGERMRRQDLGGYVLLGDPAARLPLDVGRGRGARLQRGMSRAADGLLASPNGAAESDVDQMERAVMSTLRAERQPRVLAAQYGVKPGDVMRWKEAYCQGGRLALAALLDKPSG